MSKGHCTLVRAGREKRKKRTSIALQAEPYNGILSDNKKNEILAHATTWMTLENITLRERSQPQNTHSTPLM